MSSIGAAPRAAASLSPARAEASRRNGAKSRGPKTPEGKARSSQNALKHGLRAHKHIVLPSEDAAAFAELEAALMEELAPDGALQAALAQRVVSAVWRLGRAERLEAELFAENRLAGRSLGLALIRDCNGARSFDTLLRYRGTATAELWRALRTLKALQAEQAARPEPAVVEPRLLPEPQELPVEPESLRNPGELPAPAVAQPAADLADQRTAAATNPAAEEKRRDPRQSLPRDNPIEPEARSNPDEIIPSPSAAVSGFEGFSGWREAKPAGSLAAPPQRCDPTAAPGHAGRNRPCGGPEGERERAARGRPVALR